MSETGKIEREDGQALEDGIGARQETEYAGQHRTAGFDLR